VERRRCFKGLDIFNKAENIGHFGHLSKFEFSSLKSHQLALGGCSTLHQQSTERNLGLTSFWGSIPLLLQLNFDLLFLVYLILVFRILELLCNAIKLRIEDEPRGSILGSTCCYCKKDLFLLYEKLQASFSCVVRLFFSVL
jgi:hypothetical protein